jgi:hypothetical protein
VDRREPRRKRTPHAAGALLQDVRELVPEELLPPRCGRVVAAGREVNRGADGERRRTEHHRLPSDVHAHVAEARSEAASIL